jgi:isoaspartyl peptidase/L-asparaginase-like protein (Ntn-hydrolase superfamily)
MANRREILGGAILAVPAVALSRWASAANASAGSVIIATWPFGLDACRESFRVLGDKDKQPLDAVEAGIRITEADVTNRSVGIGGLPNADGDVQLDACIMDGDRQRSGSVAGLKGFGHPISIARCVMEKTKHVMLVGDDAARFALNHGFEKSDKMPVPEAKKAWQEWKAQQPKENLNTKENHDTIALLVRRADGKLAGGCSTSGLAYKLAGRVGDSPIIGSGLYVDGRVGAAGATGIGENILRYCGSFLAVEYMRAGATPEEACKKVIERICEGEQRPASELHVNFIAVDKQGRWGAAGTDADFHCGLVTDERSEVVPSFHVS